MHASLEVAGAYHISLFWRVSSHPGDPPPFFRTDFKNYEGGKETRRRVGGGNRLGPSGRVELPTSGAGIRFPAQKRQNANCIEGFLCHLRGLR